LKTASATPSRTATVLAPAPDSITVSVKTRKENSDCRNVAGKKTKARHPPGSLVFAFDCLISRVRYFANFAI
jgi:hypothetical protein